MPRRQALHQWGKPWYTVFRTQMQMQMRARAEARYTTVEEVAALQAAAMPTTARVGDPEEDASMAALRGVLSRINALGFVTVDSQAGVKDDGPIHWQRAYISGFVPRSLAKDFVTQMNLRNSVVALAFPHGEEQPACGRTFAWRRMPRLPLTLEARHETCTSHPLAVAQPFRSMWRAMLPELGLAGDRRSMEAVAADAVQVFVTDTVWGRRAALFRAACECLEHSRARRGMLES